MGDGFEPVDADDHAVLLVEFASKGPGTAGDVKKQGALHSRLNEMLGWTGLGHCDRGSVGSGTMEVCCVVVDFEHARRVIEENLAGTEFADYSRIYDEEDVSRAREDSRIGLALAERPLRSLRPLW